MTRRITILLVASLLLVACGKEQPVTYVAPAAPQPEATPTVTPYPGGGVWNPTH